MTADRTSKTPSSPSEPTTPNPPGSPGSWDGKPLWSSEKSGADSASVDAALETVETKKPESLWKRVRSCLGHLAIFLFLGLYTAAGGIAFHEIEHPVEVANDAEMKEFYRDGQERIVDSFILLIENASFHHVPVPFPTPTPTPFDFNTTNFMVNESSMWPADNKKLRQDIIVLLEEFREIVWEVYDGGVNLDNETHDWQWTFGSSFFFASTVVTTIGYGNIAPVTFWGRLFCIIFALFGIPLTLIAIGDMGKMFASLVHKIGKQLKKCLCKKKRSNKGKDEEGDSPSMAKTWLKVFWAILLLLLYIAVGASLFMIWEEWSFFDSFYFCFITMTTIGLGDIVPEHQMFMLLCTVYILIGLAVTSTCIELARAEYEKSWQRMLEASRKLAISGPLMDALRKLNEQIDAHGGIVDMSVISDLRSALKESGIDDRPSAAPETPPLYVIYESSV